MNSKTDSNTPPASASFLRETPKPALHFLEPAAPIGALSCSVSFAPALGLAPVNNITALAPSGQTAELVQVKPLPAPVPAKSRKIRRNGRVASLPKTPRDMVNRMLWNSVPYKNIVGALSELGFTVTERNISNWATGGYLEWSLAQEHVLQNRTNQDHLVDFLRRDDAQELGEVGMQAAATRLSQVLLQKLASTDDPEAHLENYSRLVDLLCRLNREIAATQKQRDDSRRTLGREYDPVLVKEEDEISALQHEQFYSNPPAGSCLPKPRVPAAVPPIPTATQMAQDAREARQEAHLDFLKHSTALLAKISGRANPTQPTPASSPQPSASTPPQPPPATPTPSPRLSATPSVQPSSTPPPVPDPGSSAVGPR
jgi:hypothetical protein